MKGKQSRNPNVKGKKMPIQFSRGFSDKLRVSLHFKENQKVITSQGTRLFFRDKTISGKCAWYHFFNPITGKTHYFRMIHFSILAPMGETRTERDRIGHLDMKTDILKSLNRSILRELAKLSH